MLARRRRSIVRGWKLSMRAASAGRIWFPFGRRPRGALMRREKGSGVTAGWAVTDAAAIRVQWPPQRVESLSMCVRSQGNPDYCATKAKAFTGDAENTEGSHHFNNRKGKIQTFLLLFSALFSLRVLRASRENRRPRAAPIPHIHKQCQTNRGGRSPRLKSSLEV